MSTAFDSADDSFQIRIVGNGVATACCSRLLADAGLRTQHDRASRPHLAAVLLGVQTQGLLHDVFHNSEIFSGCHPIKRRTVLWGVGGEPITMPHQGLVTAEGPLLERLWQAIPHQEASFDTSAPHFSIFTSTASANEATPLKSIAIGQRSASVTRVRLRPEADPHACAIESTSLGWLFLLPISLTHASLIVVSNGAIVDDQLDESRLIVRAIERTSIESTYRSFASAPRLHTPLCTETQLRCGSAAMTFDPVCGEGVGHSIREAFLASALVRSLCDGEPAIDLFAHYETRLHLGFIRHLELCRNFYTNGGISAFWTSELAQLEHGITAMRNQLTTYPPPRYLLSSTRLVRIEDTPR